MEVIRRARRAAAMGVDHAGCNRGHPVVDARNWAPPSSIRLPAGGLRAIPSRASPPR